MSKATPSAVVDTNVVISSFLAPRSAVARSLYLLSLSHHLLANADTLGELRSVWSRPKFDRGAPLEKRRDILTRFESMLKLAAPAESIHACRDPRDDKFLSLAVGGGASLILSGDTDLLALHPFRGIAILTPAAYLNAVESSAAK